MPRVPSVAQTETAVRPLATAVRRLAVTGRSCPNCGSPEIRPSNRRTAADILFACLLLSPYRCRICRERFYLFWRRSLQYVPDPPVAPLLVMPARRNIPEPNVTPPQRIDPEPILSPRRVSQIIPLETKTEEIMLPPDPAPPAQQARILILENDLSIRKLLRRLLERKGHSIVEIDRVDDLAVLLRANTPDLLIVDVSAGAASLQDAAALMRQHPNLKILALTGEPLGEGEIPGRWLALLKPFSLDSFVERVDRLLYPPDARP